MQFYLTGSTPICYNLFSVYHFIPMMPSAFFIPVAALTIASALGVVLARDPMYAVLSLVSALFSLSGLFIGLKAYFVAVIQILIYAGAVLVLFLFVVMLLDMAPPPSGGGVASEKRFRATGKTLRVIGTFFGLLFCAELFLLTKSFTLGNASAATHPVPGTTAAVGKLLFTTYALPFEVASILLLVGIIGAVVLAKKKIGGAG